MDAATKLRAGLMGKVSRKDAQHSIPVAYVGTAFTLGCFTFVFLSSVTVSIHCPRRGFLSQLTALASITAATFKVSGKNMSDPECGRSTPASRIVMGRAIPRTRLPWIVYIESTRYLTPTTRTKQVCGGSLIAHNYVVTAAHCVVDSEGKKAHKVVIYYNATKPQQGPEVRAEVIIMHPNYDDDTLENDIALLKESLYIDHFVRPVCLPEEELNLTGQPVTIAGWGYTAENKTAMSYKLRRINRKILPYTRCEETLVEKWQAPLFNSSVILCTSSTDKDACKGDSGGPVTMWRHGLGYQVGIVSFGLGCARPNGTSLHTNLHFYLPWIASEISSRRGQHVIYPSDAVNQRVTTPSKETNTPHAEAPNGKTEKLFLQLQEKSLVLRHLVHSFTNGKPQRSKARTQ
ncbi:mite allergen Der f 3-like isoform X2 [Dermacentor albipictus]|uniref:mite allergen Der f 3-like isoform X2 n=1 Tax=Dermacentor albipictus TaxID=60249 RepID=UPI0038FC8C82